MTGPLEQGWVITLTDYPGLGTPGPNPYLVGESEGRAVLDSVRAVHNLDLGVELADDYAVWGHSQGGHAALFAGQLADDYLTEHHLAAVAALAPATRLGDNLTAIQASEVGNVVTIFAVASWSDYYGDISEEALTSDARRPAGRIADDCINQPSRFRIVLSGLRLPDTVLAIDPSTDPAWTAHLDTNTPDPAGITAPLFVAQGLADKIIIPDITETWVSDRCATGAATLWRSYPDITHPGIVGPGGADAFRWTIDRFDGQTPTTSCPN